MDLFSIIFDTEELMNDWIGVRVRSGQKTIHRRCFFQEVLNSIAARQMNGYIRYRSKKLKGGHFLAFSCTTKIDSDFNQNSVQQYINNVKTHISFTEKLLIFCPGEFMLVLVQRIDTERLRWLAENSNLSKIAVFINEGHTYFAIYLIAIS